MRIRRSLFPAPEAFYLRPSAVVAHVHTLCVVQIERAAGGLVGDGDAAEGDVCSL